MNVWRYAAWDIEAQAPCVETISYSIAKTRLRFHESDSDSDPFIRALFDISHTNNPPFIQQQNFVNGVQFVEMQDIYAYQRVKQFSSLRKVTRTFQGTKLTIRNAHKHMNEFSEGFGKYDTPKELMRPDFAALYAKIDQQDKELKSMFGGDGLLATVPYIRQKVYFAVVLGISCWTPADVDLAYDYASYLPNYRSVLTAQIELDRLE